MKFSTVNEVYKGYEIDSTMIAGMWTVVYCGDEVVFDTVDEAKRFIDEITK